MLIRLAAVLALLATETGRPGSQAAPIEPPLWTQFAVCAAEFEVAADFLARTDPSGRADIARATARGWRAAGLALLDDGAPDGLHRAQAEFDQRLTLQLQADRVGWLEDPQAASLGSQRRMSEVCGPLATLQTRLVERMRAGP